MEGIELCQDMRIEIDLQLITEEILKLRFQEIFMDIQCLEINQKQGLALKIEMHGSNKQCHNQDRIFSLLEAV